MDTDALLANVYREEAGRVIAALVRQVGDLDLAEDALQDAMAEAVVAWRRDGAPRNGGAWLLTVSRRRAIDRIRKSATARTATNAASLIANLEELPKSPEATSTLPDERLRLIFTCCHPALPEDSRVALTLRTMCGLTTTEVARAFLASETTMRQRITRAKEKIRSKGIPYAIPLDAELDSRLESVLDVVYLIFNEGYAATDTSSVTRSELCEEAIRLGRILYELMPKPEVGGLLALMLLHDSRRAARISTDGAYIALDEQDRSLWNQAQIGEGRHLLHKCLGHRRPGHFQIQAAISAVHSEARTAVETDWIQIAGLYVALSQAAPSSIVTLNHAVALSHAESPDAGLRLLESVATELQEYQPFHAAHADLLRRAGRGDDAITAYRRALDLSQSDPQRQFLQQRLSQLESHRKNF
jgi:RNA polymerase sigma-70 factor (ECF subfamily)